MSLFGKKIETLGALKGLTPEQISTEQITALTAELSANEINGIEVAVRGTSETNAASLQTANDRIAELEASLTTANERITELEGNLTTANTELQATELTVANLREQLSQFAADEVTEIKVGEDKITGKEGENEDIYKSSTIATEISGRYGI